jgi:hypothetical protein
MGSSSSLRRSSLPALGCSANLAGSYKRAASLLLILLAFAAAAFTEDRGTSPWLHVAFPRDSPVGLIDISLGESTAGIRGMSMLLDLHTQLLLRNSGPKPIRGLMLRVEAQDVTPGGQGSVTVPSLNVPAGESFSVRIDLEFLRPFPASKGSGPMVQVTLDGVLFGDLSFYGQDKLDSRRTLTIYELEARRDRQYFNKLIETGQISALREELNFGLIDLRPPQLGLELLRDLKPKTRSDDQPVQVSFVAFPTSPVQPLTGAAHIQGNEVREPHVEVRNNSTKAVRTIELGWILRDDRGRDYMAGSLPENLQLGPVQTGRLSQQGVLRFSHPSGQPMLIGSVSAFISNVEFADGNLWIPTRTDISNANVDPVVRRGMGASPEQQRLTDIYRKKGLAALAAELKKVN